MNAERSCDAWGKMAPLAVLLLTCLSNKTIGGDTPYYRMFNKHVDLSFFVEYWDPSTWGPSSASCVTFAAHPIFTSPTVAIATLTSLASVTLHMAPSTRTRQSLHQKACTFSLRGHPLQQKHPVQSTTEVELIAMSSCAMKGVYLCRIRRELGWRTFRRARIFCDLTRALHLVGQGSNSSPSKHFAITFVGLRVCTIDKKLVIDHVLTKGQLGDTTTKFLAQPIFTVLAFENSLPVVDVLWHASTSGTWKRLSEYRRQK